MVFSLYFSENTKILLEECCQLLSVTKVLSLLSFSKIITSDSLKRLRSDSILEIFLRRFLSQSLTIEHIETEEFFMISNPLELIFIL
jgi:hypothetical protein